MTSRSEWIDCREVAADLCLAGGVAALRRMAQRGEFPELLHVTGRHYLVRRQDYAIWQQSRMTSGEAARAKLQEERIRQAIGSSQ